MSREPASDRSSAARAVMRWILAAFYGVAGIAHLLVPEKLLAIAPSWVLFAPQIIFITELCDLAGADCACDDAAAQVRGICLAAYAICVWPANFKHAIDGVDLPVVANSWLYHGPRLFF